MWITGCSSRPGYCWCHNTLQQNTLVRSEYVSLLRLAWTGMRYLHQTINNMCTALTPASDERLFTHLWRLLGGKPVKFNRSLHFLPGHESWLDSVLNVEISTEGKHFENPFLRFSHRSWNIRLYAPGCTAASMVIYFICVSWRRKDLHCVSQRRLFRCCSKIWLIQYLGECSRAWL